MVLREDETPSSPCQDGEKEIRMLRTIPSAPFPPSPAKKASEFSCEATTCCAERRGTFPSLLPLWFLLFFALTTAVQAQVNTATLTGVVKDASGAGIPGANVTLIQIETGVKRSTVTGADGQYTFTFVSVGDYKLTSQASGFRDETLDNVNLVAGQSVNLPVGMSVQNVQSEVSVSAENEALNTTDSSQNTTISQSQLNEMPVLHQDWTNTLQYSSNTLKLTAAGSSSSSSQQGSGININGLPAAGYIITVDGTNASSNPEFEAYNFYQAPNIVNTVSNDAIAEISQVSGIAPASVGNTVSGDINIITKSGTNHFHGSAYENNEESLYDARNQFVTRKPRLTFNQFGGSIGGPIFKERFFFFGDYEGARLAGGKVISGTVPTPYLESISPAVYAPLFAVFPSIAQPANATALTGTYQGSGTQQQRDGSGLVRLDYHLNANNVLAVRYIRARPQQIIPQVITENTYTYSGHTDAVNANYLHIGKHWTEDTRFGFNQLKLTRIYHGFYTQLPLLSFGFSSQGANVFLQHGNITTAEEAIAFAEGKHNVQFGGIFQHNFASRYKLVTPSIGYSTLAQFQANTPSSVLLTLYDLPAGTPGFGFYYNQYGGYVQDDYHVATNLTINAGFRYDYYTVPQETLGRIFNRGINSAQPQLGPGFGAFRPAGSVFDASYQNAQPRLGFSWTPFGTAKNALVVHGGAGIFVEAHSFYTGIVGVIAPSGTEPFQIGLNQTQTTTAGLKYPIDATQYPNQLSSLQASGVLTTNLPNTAINNYNPNPVSYQRYLGVEQGMPAGFLFNLDYVGNDSAQEELYETKNLPDRVTGVSPFSNFGEFSYFTVGDHGNYNSLQTKLTKTLSHGLYASASYTWGKVLSFGDGDLLQQLSPQDNNNIRAEYGPAPYSVKNKFVLNARWELPLVAWTHLDGATSRLILGGWQISGVFTGQSGLPLNSTNSASSYPADRPNVVPTAQRYLGGYRNFPGTHQYINPAAFSIPAISPLSGAQIVGGNLQRYSLVAPGVEDLDASLLKHFRIRDQIELLVRLDSFNALNHTNFSGIVTTVNTATFGQATSATPRTNQISARINF
jgi:hypothetical protein